jgi:hypothetical protein
MATGDQNDMYNRLYGLLPPTWFGDANPVLDGVLWGSARALAGGYALYDYARRQTRILTAGEGWLDLVALDFFGTGLQRYHSQSDDSYRNRIRLNLFRERGTRPAMLRALFDLTGRVPTIVEPARPQDCGGLGISLGLGAGGAVGSLSRPYQAFVTAYRPTINGPANWPGIAAAPFGLGHGGLIDAAQLLPEVSDADIVATIEAVKPFGTTVWMRIGD